MSSSPRRWKAQARLTSISPKRRAAERGVRPAVQGVVVGQRVGRVGLAGDLQLGALHQHLEVVAALAAGSPAAAATSLDQLVTVCFALPPKRPSVASTAALRARRPDSAARGWTRASSRCPLARVSRRFERTLRLTEQALRPRRACT